MLLKQELGFRDMWNNIRERGNVGPLCKETTFKPTDKRGGLKHMISKKARVPVRN